MEASYYRLRRNALEGHFETHYTDLAEPERQAIIAERDCSHTLINFSRYEARLERSFHKSLTALRRLRAERKSEMADQSQSQAPLHPTATAPATAKVEHARPEHRQPTTDNRQPISARRPPQPPQSRARQIRVPSTDNR